MIVAYFTDGGVQNSKTIILVSRERGERLNPTQDVHFFVYSALVDLKDLIFSRPVAYYQHGATTSQHVIRQLFASTPHTMKHEFLQ